MSNKNNYIESNDPLLIYCIAIIDSISETSPKPNEEMSKECVKIMLKFNKLDLLTRLIAQKKYFMNRNDAKNNFVIKNNQLHRLTFSYTMAKYIQEYAKRNAKNSKNSYELCLFVFKEIGAHFESAICFAKLGLVLNFYILYRLILQLLFNRKIPSYD